MHAPLANVKRLLRGTRTWRDVFLLNTRSCKKLANLFSPAAWAELKSTMRLSEAGMADCRVRRVGDAGSNGKESNSFMHATRSCTSSRIRFGLHSLCFLLFLFGWPEHCEQLGFGQHCSHFWNAPAVASHSGGWKAIQISFCCLFHGTFNPHVGVGVSSDELSEISLKEGNLINREICHIAQKSGSHLPYLLLSYAIIHGSIAHNELTYSSQLQTCTACTFCMSASVIDRKSLQ